MSLFRYVVVVVVVVIIAVEERDSTEVICTAEASKKSTMYYEPGLHATNTATYYILTSRELYSYT